MGALESTRVGNGSAPREPSAIRHERDTGNHIVQFYDSETALIDAVVEFLSEGRRRGEPAIIVATEAHREALSNRLGVNGLDASSPVMFLDAEETLSKIMLGSMPDWERFEALIGSAIVELVGAGATRIRAFGEMVDLLWRDGNSRAAIRLEEMWNDLQARHPFSLYCAYVMGGFYKAGEISSICAVHDHVHTEPTNGHAPPAVLDNLSPAQARALAKEIAERKEIERALREALAERRRAEEEERKSRRRAELLYSLVRSVIAADRIEDVYSTAIDAIEAALGTSRSAVLVFDRDDVMRFKASRGLSEEYRRAVEGHSPWSRDVKAPEPVLVEDADNDPSLSAYVELFRRERIGALGFFPLVAEGRLVGKFMVYYDAARVFSAQELELARAIANHVAMAIARFASLQELQQTVRFNQMFTAILGHDLRNPLASIMTAAQLLMMRGRDEKVVKPLARILNSGNRMARMIDQLLDFTRVRVGQGIPLQPKSIDLVPLLNQVMDELDDANPEWTLRLDHSGDTRGEWDEDRLAQVFSNLIGNGVQHGAPEHGLLVRVDGTQEDGLLIEVHNKGVVPAELLPTLFEPMSGGEHRREKSFGLGLGLFITQQIVRAHGGSVTVRSSDPEGTTFTVSLPRTIAPKD
jgi:signal transduction histidine kinase